MQLLLLHFIISAIILFITLLLYLLVCCAYDEAAAAPTTAVHCSPDVYQLRNERTPAAAAAALAVTKINAFKNIFI